MAERRSLGDALSISPEKRAFIQGEAQPPSKERSAAASTTVEISLPASASQGRTDKPQRRASGRDLEIPNADDILGEVLVPLTTRLPHRLIQALRRLCLEQRLRHAKPDSIQDIVESAIHDWLRKQ